MKVVTDIEPPATAPSRFGRVVARLTGANLLIVAFAVVTSPILTRTLGPSGRGEVAAVFAVVGISPWISDLGITSFLGRERARGTQPLGELLGSITPIVLITSLVGVAAAVPLAHLLGQGRPVVVEFIEIGLFVLPLNAFLQILLGVVVGEQRWRFVMLVKILNSGGTAAAIVTLSLLGSLTVTTVAITYVTAGVLANVPLLIVLRKSRPWRFLRPTARTGLAFGLRSWLSTLANLGNASLDQVLMAGLVSSRQLGLYALAVTLSTTTSALVGATVNALFPRVAAGESQLAARACRVTVLLVGLSGVAIGVTSPIVVPFVFGHAFSAAIPMLIVLLCATLFFVPSQVLGSALVAAGNPSATARAQIAGLVVTVPALILVLPVWGGIGAAWVSLGAYAVTFAIILVAARKTFSLSARTLLIARRSDVGWLLGPLLRRHASSHV
jgi:O-antigen/teichoic acid export membrane protein